MKKGLLLIVFDKGFGLRSPVYLSQYLYRHISSEEEGKNTRILVPKTSPTDIKEFIARIPTDYDVNIIQYRNWLELLNLVLTHGRQSKVVVRSLWSALACFFANTEYIYDLRGDLKAESSLRNGRYVWILGIVESFVLRRATVVWAVSKALTLKYSYLKHIQFKDYCKSHKWISDLSDHSKVFGEKSVVNVVYSGGLQSYQRIDAMLKIWQELSGSAVPFSFTFLTKSRISKDLVMTLNELGVEVLSLRPSEVDAYLLRSDIAFMLRDRSDVNVVSSPVKFADYINAGLLLVTTLHTAVVKENYCDVKDQVVLLDEIGDAKACAARVLKAVSSRRGLVFNNKFYY